MIGEETFRANLICVFRLNERWLAMSEGLQSQFDEPTLMRYLETQFFH